MKKEDISEALNDVDFDMVEEAYEKTEKKKKIPWLKWGTLAASLVLVAGVIVAVPMFQSDDPQLNVTQPDTLKPDDPQLNVPQPDTPKPDDPQLNVPQWDTAHFSAEEIAKLFSSGTLDGGTNAYTKVPVSHSKYLYVNEPTDQTNLNIYEVANTGKDLSEEELRSFTDSILPRLSAALGVEPPEYEVKSYDYSTNPHLSTFIRTEPYFIDTVQSATHCDLSVSTTSSSDRKISLNGVPLQIDQRLSDEEIINSLAAFKDQLFAALGVSFPNTKILRYFDENSLHGATSIYIYFYDESAHPLNTSVEIPVSDYIRIRFDNLKNYESDIVSDDILHVAYFSYTQYRADANDTYPLIAQAEKLSLEEAEELLFNGYVFGNHVCNLCMQQQALVSFKDYDFVGMEYVLGEPNSDHAGMAIPFYVFYQHIGTAANGNHLYAKTYVAAIAVSGYAEYYESQNDKH